MTRPLRVLHIVHPLGVGGIEMWLIQVLERMDRREIAIDVMVQADAPGVSEPRVRATGAAILRCPQPLRLVSFAKRFRRLLREHGPYDVVHSHLYHWSGYLLYLAHQEGVPLRIAHSRNADLKPALPMEIPRAVFFAIMKYLLNKHMTHGLAVSDPAGRALYGPAWPDDPRCLTCPSGIDLTPFHQSVDRQAVRDEFDIDSDTLVVGHVGRFESQKNHPFIVHTFDALLKRHPNARLCLVGAGQREPALRAEVRKLGLEAKVHFLGNREDVPRLMMGLFDLLLFPSRHEGMGRVVMEAQAAGLPSVIASHLPENVDVIPDAVRRVSLDQPIDVWAQALLDAAQASHAWRRYRLATIEQSPFSVDSNVRLLVKLYRSALPAAS